MSFSLCSVGVAIVIGGLSYAAYLAHMAAHWILVGASNTGHNGAGAR